MAKSSEAKNTQIKAPKTRKGISKIRVLFITVAAILAIICFVASIKAGSVVDSVSEAYTQKIVNSNSVSNEQIKELTAQFNADRQDWVEKNMPEVIEKYQPEIDATKKDKEAALKGVTDENEIAEIAKPFDSRISTIQKAMDSEINPVFNTESDIAAKFKEDEAAIRSAGSDNAKKLSLEMDDALIYPTHVSDIFTILTVIFLGIVLWLVAGMLANLGFLKGSPKILELVPFAVLLIEVCVVLIAITGLSFGDHVPAELSTDFNKYMELFKAVL